MFAEHIEPGHIEQLDQAIAYLETTDPGSWWGGPTYRSPDGTQHCALSHIAEHLGMEGMETFENVWSTSYVIGAVNDGKHPEYQQATPKERCLAYLNRLRNGAEKDVMTSMLDDYYALKETR